MGVLGDEDHKQMSLATVTSYELFSNGVPVDGGVYDLRMGTTDHHFRCKSCQREKGGVEGCPTHPGVAVLHSGAYVYSSAFVNEIRRWLRATCWCGAPREDPALYAGVKADKRLAAAAAAATEGTRCKGCRRPYPKITKDAEDHFTFWAETVATGNVRLQPAALRAWFESIADATVVALGRSLDAHPRKLMLGVVCIPASGTHPGVKSYGSVGSYSHHDATNMLQYIVKRNGSLPERMPAVLSDEQDRSLRTLCQLVYDLVIGSASTSATQGSGGKRGIVVGARAAPSYLRRLPRKKGRIRENVLGMRVFNISRSTISGNTALRSNQVGVPISFARTLQVETVVQEYNRDEMMRYYLNGRGAYPGCSRVTKRATGLVYEVGNLPRDFQLEIGDKLMHDIVDGLPAFFNRQPTLEPSSISVMEVVVIKDPTIHTFQMNVLSCSLFNADFDGDAMNLWIPHSTASRVEAAYMAPVVSMFISAKTSAPVGGQVQDSVVGVNKLTRAGVVMDKWHAMSLFATTGLEPPNFSRAARPLQPSGTPRSGAQGVEEYTGHDVVSLLYKAHGPVNYARAPTYFNEAYAPFIAYNKKDIFTVMERGELKQGVLDKRSVGEKQAGGINHLVAREFGSARAMDLIFALQQIAVRFLMCTGFTIGTADLTVSAKALAAFRTSISGVLTEADLLTAKLANGEIIPPIDTTVREYFEKLMRNVLRTNDAEILSSIMGSVRLDTNGLLSMILSGAKGNTANLLAIMASIGQITINGERVRESFSFRRTSPYYPRFATAPAARGYIANSYMSGMTSAEFVFSAMNGRFDLITKALSTSVTGHNMRKGVMSAQSIITDNTHRAMKDTRVVQQLYGEDGLDARQLEKVSFRTMSMSDADVWGKLCSIDGRKLDLADEKDPAVAAYKQIIADRGLYRSIFGRVEAVNFRRPMGEDVWLAVNVRRLAEAGLIAARAVMAETPAGTAAGPREPLAPKLARVAALCDAFPYLLINEIQERRGTPIPRYLRAAVTLQVMVVRAELNPRVLNDLSLAQIDGLVLQIRQRYSMSLISSGVAGGILACCSVSEPLTQYMLDSHHRSVSGGTSKAGLVRVSELLGARGLEVEASAVMLLPVLPAYATAEMTREIANSIEFMRLVDAIARHDVMHEPYAAVAAGTGYPLFRGDAAWLAEFERGHPLLRPPPDLTPWGVRVVVDKTMLVLKSLSVERIVQRARAAWPHLYIVHTSESAREVVIRAFARASAFRRGAAKAAAEELAAAFLATPIRGIPGIITATPEQITRSVEVTDPAAPDFGALRRTTTWAIATAGTNVPGVLLNPYIDHSAIVTSSVPDTIRVWGICAGRNKIVTEMRGFMEDNTPNLRHLLVYADEMTRLGRYTGIERGGLAAREPNNIMLRMAASAPIQVVTDAALACTRGKVYGVAAPLMFGAIPKLGTTYNALVVDEPFVAANTKTTESVLDSL